MSGKLIHFGFLPVKCAMLLFDRCEYYGVYL